MALINNKVNFDETQKNLIQSKQSSPSFHHANWGDEDLLDLRIFIRNFYRKEQTALCVYCRNQVSLTSALNSHVEHIAPKSIYPQFMFTPENLCVSCADCNAIKSGKEAVSDNHISELRTIQKDNPIRYPSTSMAFKIVHPHFDDWGDHLVRTPEGYYLDLTDKGAFTNALCRLNRRLHEFGYSANAFNMKDDLNVVSDLLE